MRRFSESVQNIFAPKGADAPSPEIQLLQHLHKAEEEASDPSVKVQLDGEGILYEVVTHTSDIAGAGTDSDIYVILYGKHGFRTTQHHLCPDKKERKKFFGRADVDKFLIEMEKIEGPIEKLIIGHDGTGWGAGWHLDKVTIRKVLEEGEDEDVYVFPCHRWFARDEDDGHVVRELVRDRKQKLSSMDRKEIIQMHRALTVDLNHKRRAMSNLQAILHELKDLYKDTKGDCFCFRYEDIINMIEEALVAYDRFNETESRDDEKRKLLSPLSRLKDECRKYSTSAGVSSIGRGLKSYHKMTDMELQDEVQDSKQILETLSAQVLEETERLDKLRAGFKHSETYCFLRRYAKLRALIEDVTKDCLNDSEMGD